MFKPFFQRNQELHNYSTRIADHFHIPLVISDLGKTGIRFRGAVIWNSILNDGINPAPFAVPATLWYIAFVPTTVLMFLC